MEKKKKEKSQVFKLFLAFWLSEYEFLFLFIFI